MGLDNNNSLSVSLFVSWGTELYATSKSDKSPTLIKISDLVEPEIAYKFLLVSIVLIFFSTIVRYATNESSDKSGVIWL